MRIGPSFRKHTRTVESDSSTIIDSLKSYLNALFYKKSLRQLAEGTGFVKRSSAKLTGNIFITTMLAAALDTRYYSLEELCSLMREIDSRVDIEPQSLMERINTPEAAAFLEVVQKRSIEKQLQKELAELPPAPLKKFKKLLLQDSTVMMLHEKLQAEFKGSGGRASKASLKIDLIYDLLGKKIESTVLTDMRCVDQVLAKEALAFIEKDCLVIRDLGYSSCNNLEDIQNGGGFFLCRNRSDFAVFLNDEDETPINLAAYLNTYHANKSVIDFEVYVTLEKFKVRMVVYRTPQEIADARKRKANATAKKQGRTVRKETLSLMNFTIFLTNVPREMWEPEIIGSIYRLRWTIELIFKNWKSEMKIHHLPGINPHRIRCLIFSKLLAVVIMNQIYRMACRYEQELNIEVSMNKVIKWIRNNNRLANMIKGGWLEEFWNFFITEIPRVMTKQKRRRKTVTQVVQESLSFIEGMELA